MIRVGQLMLVVAAIGLWVASRLPWVAVASSDGLGQPKTSTLTGATWSNALIPLAVLLLAAAIAGLAVHGWGLRVVARAGGPGEPGARLSRGQSDRHARRRRPRAIELAQVPVMALVASERHYLGAGVTLAAAVLALLAAVLLMRSAGAARQRRPSTPRRRPGGRRLELGTRSPSGACGTRSTRVVTRPTNDTEGR